VKPAAARRELASALLYHSREDGRVNLESRECETISRTRETLNLVVAEFFRGEVFREAVIVDVLDKRRLAKISVPGPGFRLGRFGEIGVDRSPHLGAIQKLTALDGRRLGLGVVVIVDGCRAVNVRQGDEDGALAEMRGAGVSLMTTDDLLRKLRQL
jgi:hypothetical protein